MASTFRWVERTDEELLALNEENRRRTMERIKQLEAENGRD